MEQLFLKQFFSRNCTLRGKNDVQLTFDGSYTCNVKKLMFSKVVLVKFSLMELLFPKKFFYMTCTLRENNDVQLNSVDKYRCYVSKIDVYKVFLC